MKKTLRWLWQHRKLTAALTVLVVFGLLNVFAFIHAWAMTHFVAGGAQTRNPEALSRLDKARLIFTGVHLPKPVNEMVPTQVGLTYEARAIADDGQPALVVWDIPHPRARGRVLLFHGYVACKARLLQEARVFHDLGYSICLVDFRGSGGSEGSNTTIGVREANDVVRALAHEGDRPGPCILYGQSMGSAAILRAISIHGARPDSVILECPFDTLLGTVQTRFSVMGLPAFPCAQLLVFWGGVQQGFNGFTHNPVDYARDVHCPTLLLRGERDSRVPAAAIESIYRNLSGVKHLETFEGVGHRSCCAQSPEQWKHCVAAFLEQHAR